MSISYGVHEAGGNLELVIGVRKKTMAGVGSDKDVQVVLQSFRRVFGFKLPCTFPITDAHRAYPAIPSNDGGDVQYNDNCAGTAGVLSSDI